MDRQNTEVESYLNRLGKDFPFFLTQVWKCIGLPTPSPVQMDVAWWLQHGPRRWGVRGFRGLSKTFITIAFALWKLYNNPNDRITIVSKSEGHAKNSLFMARKWIESVPFLKRLAPNQSSTKKRGKISQRDSAKAFDVAGSVWDRTPSFSAYGIKGQITGVRSTLLIADDVETKENTQTVEMRKRLRDQVKEFDHMIVPDAGEIVFLGTPHHEETLYDDLANSGFAFRAWPVRFPAKKEAELTCGLSPWVQRQLDAGLSKPGDPVWPERFTDEELTARLGSVGIYDFNMQYMVMSIDPKDLAYRIRLEDFIMFEGDFTREKAPASISWGKSNHHGTTAIDSIPSVGLSGDKFYAPIFIDENWAPFSRSIMYIDPSPGVSDPTAWCAIGELSGMLWVKEADSFHGTQTTENLDKLAHAAKRNRVQDIYIEENFGGAMMAMLLGPRLQRLFEKPTGTDPGWSCSIQTVHNTKQKEARILDTLSGPAKSHRIVLGPQPANNQEFCKQITRITRQRNCLPNDDLVDAFAGCVAQFQDDLDQDMEKQAQRYEDEVLEQEMKEAQAFMDGISSNQGSWINI